MPRRELPVNQEKEHLRELLLTMRSKLREALKLLDEYNLYARQAHNLGYLQIPKAWSISGATTIGMYDLDEDVLDDWIENPPNPSSEQDIQNKLHEECEARRFSSGKNLSRKERLGVSSRWTCHYCKRSGNVSRGPDGKVWHTEHKIPRSRGGPNTASNCVLSCASCNIRKGTLTDTEFIAVLSRERLNATA
jgi:5-methylcytosine-specific restriction endonuclease McrA